MTVEELAAVVIDACEAESIKHMLTGALAFNNYGVPRSTKDVDFVLEVLSEEAGRNLRTRLDPLIEFDPQVQFDTLTWGKRQIGSVRRDPSLIVELFDLLDDPFSHSCFGRRLELASTTIGRSTWLPTPEDVIVQKLRRGRSKDLDDALQVLAVQGLDILDMAYIQRWCAEHGNGDRLQAALDAIPPI